MAALWYRSGNLTLTQGSQEVSGAETAFIANVRAGDMLIAPTSDLYEVTAVVNDTSLTIDRDYEGASYSGTAWAIAPTSANLKLLAKQISDLVVLYQTIPDEVSAGASQAQAAVQATQDARDVAKGYAADAKGSVSAATDKAAQAAQSAADAAASKDTAVSASGSAAAARAAAEAAQASAESTASAANTTLTNANAAVDAATRAISDANSAASNAEASASAARGSAQAAAASASSAIETANGAVAATGQLATGLGSLDSRVTSLWNGTTLNLTPGGRFVTGNFDGLHSDTTTSFRQGQPSTTVTYLPVVPPSGGHSAFTICRTAASPNSGFVSLGVDGSAGLANLTFSRHGTGLAPTALRLVSASADCGFIYQDGSWTLGPAVGVTAANARTRVSYNGGTSQWGLLMCPRADNTVAIAFQNASGVLGGSISVSPSTTAYNTASDYRLKDVTGLTESGESLARLMLVRIREYTWKADGKKDRGVLAHELAEVYPNAVTGEKDAILEMPGFPETILPQGVDYSKLVPDLVAAVQGLQRTITELTQRVETLEAAASAQQPQST